MFGWEFPPHISGGLGTACAGLTEALVRENVNLIFVVPRAYGDEKSSMQLVSASHVAFPKASSAIDRTTIKSSIKSIMEQPGMEMVEVPSLLSPYTAVTRMEQRQEAGLEKWNHIMETSESTRPGLDGQVGNTYPFSGTYGANLMTEVAKYAEVAAVIARQHTFDIIHAHDWLTYPAGIMAKAVSGRPLVVHVHATEFDRAGTQADPRVVAIEREGMTRADRVITVSQWTKEIITKKYGVAPHKVFVIHNGVAQEPRSQVISSLPPLHKPVVTFLGRITYQKGPQYFIDAAKKVLQKIPDTHFVMAGAGDLLPKMIEQVARIHLSKQFHFTGFLKGTEVDRLWKITQVYVMPSVSEPFGIAPLEAIQAGVPVIISRQSGVAEVVKNAIKVDFWNSTGLANAIVRILKNRKKASHLVDQSMCEIRHINWTQAAKKVMHLYHATLDKAD